MYSIDTLSQTNTVYCVTVFYYIIKNWNESEQLERNKH